MSTQTAAGPAVDPTSAGDSSLDDLITRAAELKGELVTFAQSSRFAGRLTRLLRDAADRHGYLDEGTAVLTIDHFALQYRLPDGRAVVERFVAQRRPQLSDDEREMVLGWRDVVEGCFEVRRNVGDTVELHNLLDDLVYRVYSNMGREALARLRPGMFAICRIVPVHPATDAWLISGTIAAFPKSARRQIAQTALQQITAHPQLLRRNPALLRRAWEIQAEHRAEFIAQVGSDLVVLPPHEAQETMREHYRRWQRKAAAKLEGKGLQRNKALLLVVIVVGVVWPYRWRHSSRWRRSSRRCSRTWTSGSGACLPARRLARWAMAASALWRRRPGCARGPSRGASRSWTRARNHWAEPGVRAGAGRRRPIWIPVCVRP